MRLTLAAPIKTHSSMVVPAGTVANGRIMRVQRNYGVKSDMSVAICLETIEAAGKLRPARQ